MQPSRNWNSGVALFPNQMQTFGNSTMHFNSPSNFFNYSNAVESMEFGISAVPREKERETTSFNRDVNFNLRYKRKMIDECEMNFEASNKRQRKNKSIKSDTEIRNFSTMYCPTCDKYYQVVNDTVHNCNCGTTLLWQCVKCHKLHYKYYKFGNDSDTICPNKMLN